MNDVIVCLLIVKEYLKEYAKSDGVAEHLILAIESAVDKLVQMPDMDACVVK